MTKKEISIDKFRNKISEAKIKGDSNFLLSLDIAEEILKIIEGSLRLEVYDVDEIKDEIYYIRNCADEIDSIRQDLEDIFYNLKELILESR